MEFSEAKAIKEHEMTKNVVWALVLIVLSVIFLIFCRGTVEVNLFFKVIYPLKAMAFLFLIALGCVIGLLLK